MSNIFNFPPRFLKGKEGDALEESLAADGTVSFGEDGRDVQISPADGAAFEAARAVRALDWSNQELADLYRVKRLLDAAGVANDVQRGTGDEGDPWFVFCRADGDVFVHICRIGRDYVLDSPNLDTPLRGSCFRDLIDNFTNGTLRSPDETAALGRKLVRFERGGKISLHPATLLAALIWSIVLNSEELVLLAPEGDAADPLVAGGAASVPALAAGAPEVFADGDGAHGDEADLRDAPAVAPGKVAAAGLVLPATGLAASLSAVAIAYGFLSEIHLDDAPAVASADEAVRGVSHGGEAEPLVAEASGLAERGWEAAVALGAGFGNGLGEAPRADTLDIALAGLALPEPATPDVPLLVADLAQTDTLIPLPGEVPPARALTLAEPVVSAGKPAPEAQPDEAEIVLASLGIPAAQAPNGESEGAAQPFQMANLTAPDTAVEWSEILFGDTLVRATFELSQLSGEEAAVLQQALNLTPQTPEPTEPITDPPITDPTAIIRIPRVIGKSPSAQDPTQADTAEIIAPTPFKIFDANARAYVDFVLTKSGEFEIVTLQKELIFIDMNAIEAKEQEKFSMSWSVEDGGTISMIGLKQDFIQFEIIT